MAGGILLDDWDINRDSSRDQGKGTDEYGDQGALHAVSTGKAVKSHGDFSGWGSVDGG